MPLGHEFVRQLLDTVVQPSKPNVTVYSPKVVHHLLTRRAVSTSMVAGGLIPVLLSRKDWVSLFAFLQGYRPSVTHLYFFSL